VRERCGGRFRSGLLDSPGEKAKCSIEPLFVGFVAYAGSVCGAGYSSDVVAASPPRLASCGIIVWLACGPRSGGLDGDGSGGTANTDDAADHGASGADTADGADTGESEICPCELWGRGWKLTNSGNTSVLPAFVNFGDVAGS